MITTLSEPEQLDFADGRTVVMTPKDAVKCERFARERWYSLEVDVVLDSEVAKEIVASVQRVVDANRKARALGSLGLETK